MGIVKNPFLSSTTDDEGFQGDTSLTYSLQAVP
jgi:hypothetical protein